MLIETKLKMHQNLIEYGTVREGRVHVRWWK